MDAEGACGGCVSKVEVEVQHVGSLHLQFCADEVHQHIPLFQLILQDAENGQHVLLLAQFHTIVHLAVEVYGEVADLQQWAADMQKPRRGVHGVGASDNHASCYRQRTVEPSGHDGAAIYLGVQFDDAAFARHLCLRLYAECRRVAMCAEEPETSFCHWLLPNVEGIDGRVVLRDEYLVAGLEPIEAFCGIKMRVPVLLQHVGDSAYSKEVYGRCVEEFQ